MPSVIRIGGRLYAASRDYRRDHTRAFDARPLATNTRPDENPCDGTPIPPDSPDSPFRAGQPYLDQHENVVYRVVSHLRVEEGWGTAGFWIDRWGCYYSDLIKLVNKGWLDAAIVEGSSVKRFRCRDEARVLQWLSENLPPKPTRKATKPKSRTRKGL